MSQYINDFVGGKPFGDGRDGDLTISSNTTFVPTVKSCNGSSGTKTLYLDSGSFSNNDLILIHQSRGTGVGQWELNLIQSGGGSNTLTLYRNLDYTYTDSGASQAQVMKVLQYRNFTLSSGITLSQTSWDGNTGGIIAFAVRQTASILGTISNIGTAGNTGTCDMTGYVTGGGFRGGGVHQVHGAGSTCHNPSEHLSQDGGTGEGTSGESSESYGANGNGGGGGKHDNHGGGAGGGNGVAGSNGAVGSSVGGSTAGNAALTNMVFGGGGGSGQIAYSNSVGRGGSGAGIILIFAHDLDCASGSIVLTGGSGADAGTGSGGGGAGGSFLLKCYSATIGTNRITALGGSTGSGGGAGGAGRIAVDYYESMTGTSNPSVTSTFDGRLKVPSGMMQIVG